MNKIFFIVLLMISAAGYGQFDSGNNTFSIPPANYPVPEVKTPEKPAPFAASIFDAKPSERSRTIPEKSNFKFDQTNDFVNPGDRYLEKLNKPSGDGGDYTMFRKNQYLGDFKTSSGLVNINYRDHQAVDGDEIRVWVNDRIVMQRIRLDNTMQGFELTLEKGFNKIDFEALNQGQSGPNTAEFRIYDDKGALISSNRWDLATGFKATIIIVKE